MKRTYRKPMIESEMLEQTSLACAVNTEYETPITYGVCSGVKDEGAVFATNMIQCQNTVAPLYTLTDPGETCGFSVFS